MKKIMILLVVMGLVMGLSVSSLAWGGRGTGRMDWGRSGYPNTGNYQVPGRQPAQELGLTDEQIAQIEELRKELVESSQEIREQLNEKRQAQHELYFSPESSPEDIEAAQQELNGLREELTVLRNEFMLGLRGILTEEQLEKAAGYGRGLGLGFRMGAGNSWRFGPQAAPGGPAGRFNFRGQGYYGPQGRYGMGCRW